MELDGIEDVYELSPIQEGLLFHNLYAPGSGIYLEQVTMRMRGALDVEAYRRAWQTIVDRHAVLRTSFHWEGVDKALQVVHRDVPFPIEVLDWRDATGDEQRDRYARFGHDDRMSGFDYAAAPLMRGRLIRFADDDWEFFWSFSHLLMDGWSFGLAFAELTALYNAYATGGPVDLPEARPYRAYLAWWARQDRSETERFWREYLAGHTAPDALEIGSAPTGPFDPDQPTHAVLPTPELLDQLPPLTDFAREHGLTLNTVMQGAWMIVLSRYLGREDVLAGSTGTQRPATLTGSERIMGPMLATMPVRARVRDDAELIGWLRDLQNGMARAREHADISLTDLRGLADLPGNRPLFELDLAFENVPVPEMALHRVELVESTYDGRPHFPITMIVMPGEAMPVPRLVYDQTRFTEAAVRRLVDQFSAVLDNMVRYPDLRLGEMDIMPIDQWRELLLDWNRCAPQPAAPALPQLFAARAEATPDAVAVVCGDQRLGYAEVRERADRLAQHLRSLGVRPGDRVGLCLQRSVDTVVAVLGVLTAGAAYVPLDLGHPAERMRYILADAEVGVLVTHDAVADSAPAFDGPVVNLDTDAARIAAQPAEPPADGPTPDSIAYLIYTSGSTGRPKGVLVTHRNVTRLVSGAGSLMDLTADDAWSLVHSYAFDVSVFEMWGAFGHGARLVVVPHDAVRNPEALLELLAAERVTVFSQTPSAFRQFMVPALVDGAPRLPLRYVIFAGEYLDTPALAPWIDRYGDDAPQLVNMYGITETTVHSTYHRITRADLTGGVRSNVGRPLPDLRIYLLDARRMPVPPGMRGEIYVAGDGVTVGYQNLPELTGQRYLADLYCGEPEQRMYRSGDLARWTDDGELEFLGRADQQVKIRGFRVEPGEIEAALRDRPGVADAVVLPREIAGDTRLVAYVVPAEGETVDPELTAGLRGLLPEYMVPAHVLTLDRFPLTPNGKIDRAALPDFDGTRPELAREYVAPRTPTEETVAAAWREIIGVEKVGVHDDFFALGGHSLLATRVAFKLRGTLGVEVPVRALFDQPVLADLAAVIDGLASRPAAPVIARQPRLARQV